MSSLNPPQSRPLPLDVRSRLAQIELEYQSGELTQRGYEIRRSRILSPVDLENFHLSHEIPSGRLNTAVVYTCLWRRLTWLE
jgi:hypothetical protein